MTAAPVIAAPRDAAPIIQLPPLPRQWTFYVDRTVSRMALGPVQPVAFSYTSLLNGFGSGSVELPVDQTALTPTDMLDFWTWRLWALYGGVPMWCGCPTGLEDIGNATVSLTLTELSGYLARRQYDPAGGHVYTQVEQTLIAQDIAAPLADVGVGIVRVPGPGFLRDRTYAYLEGESRADLLGNLSGVISGVEFRTEYALDPSTSLFTATLRIAYPRVGSGASGLGVVIPGNAIGYTGTWDADEYRTHTFAVGAIPPGSASTATQPVIVTDRPKAGVPRLDAVDDWQDVVLLSTLRERSSSAATIYASPAYQLAASTFETAPALGGYGLGDDVTINVRTPFTQDGFLTLGRLVGIAVDAATGKVDWTVATSQPPAKPRRRTTQRLDALDAQLASTFHTNPAETT